MIHIDESWWSIVEKFSSGVSDNAFNHGNSWNFRVNLTGRI